MVQLYADGFGELAPREKTLVYHLSRPRSPGATSTTTSATRRSLDMREVIEAVLTHADNVAPDTLARVHHYAKLFWLNSGPHNGQTARKFVLRCEPAAFAAAVRAAANDGARLPMQPGETLDAMLARLAPCFFDPEFDAMRHQQDAGRGPRHPRDEREQPLRRREPRRPRGLPRALSPQLAPREARRAARRRGVPRRRPVRPRDRGHRPAPRGGACRTRRRRWREALGALDPVLPDGRSQRPRGVRHRVGAATRTRPWTPSTASSRSTSTRAA